MAAFLAANVLVVATSVRLAMVAPLRSGLDRVIAATVVAVSQVVASLLVAGALIRTLSPGAVVVVNAAIAAAVFAATARLPSRARWRPRLSVSGLWRRAKAHRWVALLVVAAGLALLWRQVIAYAFPPYGYDTLAYHLTTVAGWLQYGQIGTRYLHVYSASFPADVELLFTWMALFVRDDAWITLVQVPLALLGAAAVAGMARLAAVRPPGALAAAALFVLSPIVLTQASSGYVDLGTNALFLAGIYFVLRSMPPATWASGDDSDRPPTDARWSWSYLALGGSALGVAAGAKPTGPLLGLIAVLCLGAGLVLTRRRVGGVSPTLIGSALAWLLVPMLCLGAFWYVRAWIEFSNPLYPGDVKLFGLTVFHGPGIGLSRLPSGSGITALIHSWGYDLTRILNRSSGRWDRADEYQGGLGTVWLVVGLPLLLVWAIGVWRRHRALFWTLLMPLGVLFAIQPYRWWNRFTIFLLAPAFVAVVAFLDRSDLRRTRAAVRSLVLASIGVSLWLSSTHVVGWGHDYAVDDILAIAAKPAPQRTLGRLFLPELRWVDGVAPKARIAVYLSVDTRRDRFPPFYGLYGRHFGHRVFALPATSRTATRRWLRAHSIDYVYVRRPSAQDTWLSADGRFRRLFADARVGAYAVVPRAVRPTSRVTLAARRRPLAVDGRPRPRQAVPPCGCATRQTSPWALSARATSAIAQAISVVPAGAGR